MKLNFDNKKAGLAFTFIAAAVAGVGAFLGSINDAKQARTVEDLTKRVAELEKTNK